MVEDFVDDDVIVERKGVRRTKARRRGEKPIVAGKPAQAVGHLARVGQSGAARPEQEQALALQRREAQRHRADRQLRARGHHPGG